MNPDDHVAFQETAFLDAVCRMSTCNVAGCDASKHISDGSRVREMFEMWCHVGNLNQEDKRVEWLRYGDQTSKFQCFDIAGDRACLSCWKDYHSVKVNKRINIY